MPGKIKVKVLAGRNLPVMDRASDTTDAFVEIKFGSVTHKTDVCRKSLNPHWNSTEWYRFEVDESELQDEPLQLRLMDHDTYSANDAIGKVVISLAPLLAREANNAKSTATPHGGAVMSGWIPVFDTMHGIRGELNVIVKVELFSDFNKYKTSSCGVQFFHCPLIPPGYRATAIHGFVEELVVNDDPEYQWIDKIRTPRASNEARQVAFIKLSNQVQRLIGLKAAELGANAVVGYQQDFDLEGEAGVVARAVGTAVSITPLPTPSQPLNMPPCTQQQLKKYLDILATDNESITEMSQYYQSHQDELQKLLNILNPNASSLLDETDALEDDEKSMDLTRQSSITSYAGSMSIYQDDYSHPRSLRHLSEDQTDLNRLLNKDSDDSDSSGPLNKIKKMKTNFFTRRFSKRSRRSSGSGDKQEDNISLQSNASDTSRISLVDIKNEFKKLKRLKKPKFRGQFVNKEDEGEGMASILARSIIHVQTSLACIAENQDSEASPGSTMRRTSESEPTINMSDEDKTIVNETENKEDDKTLPEIRFSSLSNLSSDEPMPERQRKISESCPATPIAERSDNLLKLPGDIGYFGSVSSALSGESSELESSSDDEDDESSDVKTDTERSIETTSSVVQSVLSHNLDPTFKANLDKKLETYQICGPDEDKKQQEVKPVEKDIKAVVEQQVFDNQVLIDKCKSLESVPQGDFNKNFKEKTVKSNQASTSSVKDDTCVTKPSSHHIKFHNPFAHKKTSKSISEPSSPVDKGSFVNRSSRRIRRQLSKLSKSNMIKSISHYSLHPKKKENKTPLSQPGSSSDVNSKAPSETVLGSPFLSYNDLLSLDSQSVEPHKFFHKSDEFDRVKVSMYIGSEPVSRTSLSGISFLYPKEEHHESKHALKSTGLVHTAMETILLDKVQSLLIPTSPDPDSVRNKQFFDDVNEKLGRVEEYRNNNEQFASNAHLPPRPKSHSPPVNNKPVIVSSIRKADAKPSEAKHKDKPHGLVQTAMETMLMDRVQSVLMPSTPETPVPELTFESNERPEKHEGSKHKAKRHSLIHSLLGSKHGDSTTKSGGLVHTAMETMLMEKVQSVLGPETPEPPSVFDEYDHAKIDDWRKIDHKPSGLVQTAVETMLLDRVQASALGANVPDPVVHSTEGHGDKAHHEDESTGMTHTAIGTILMDKVHSLVGHSGLNFVEPRDDLQEESEKFLKSSKDDLKSSGLLHTAIETILLDKVQASSLGAPVPDPIVPVENVEEHHSKPHDEAGGLTHTAVETILMEKVRSLVAQPGMTFVEPKAFTADELEKAKHMNDDLISPGLVKSAVKSILLEKAQELTEHGEEAVEKLKDVIEKPFKGSQENIKSTGLIHTAFETVLLDKVQTLIPTDTVIEPPPVQQKDHHEKPKKPAGLITTAVQTMLLEKAESLFPNANVDSNETKASKPVEKSKSVPEPKKKNKTLTRQDSVHSITENETPKMSKQANIIVSSSDVTNPVLQSHPIRALETIPSLPECSVDIDVEETNNSVCDNSHAVCGANRSEKEKDRREDRCDKDRGSPRHARHESYGGRDPAQAAHAQNSSLNATSTPLGIHRRSSDSDLSVTPKGGSLNTSAGNVGSGGGAILRPSMNSNNLDMLEYPFLTMTEFPPGFIVHIGGTVCARSVKLADGGEGALRAAWWAELRTELRAHARALRCNAVIAYTDTTAICEDVCVLSASGTAAVINLDCDFNADSEPSTANSGSKNAIDEMELDACSMAHVPYSPGAGPYRAELSTCGGCRRARVPTVLLATCTKPNKLVSHAKAVTVTAVAARVRRAPPTSEPGARDISDQLPFLEYELHKLLLAKLRMQGANALFSLQTQIAVGERCVMALASGTACRLAALPPPAPPTIKASEKDKDALEIQRALWDSFSANRAANGFDIGGIEHSTNGVLSEAEGEDAPALDLCADKDACVLELDEAEDVETARALAKRHVNMQVYTHGLKPVIGAAPQAFAQVWRGRLSLSGGGGVSAGERHVRRALDGVAYKLRRLQPLALVAPRFQLELPEDEIQLVVSGAAIPLLDPNSPEANGLENGHTQGSHGSQGSQGSQGNGSGDADDDIFALDEEQLVKSQPEVVEEKNSIIGHVPTTVSLTTLSHVSGSRVSRRLCALRLLFVRETTAVRELGGLSGFLHTFTCEVMAIVRSYTAALGGNALTSFYITQLMLQDNAHKNQGQCLLSVGGDVVHITY
ncbi:unnamed protein product [Chrysodeixis includens]|uniref:C2 domain-containing protein n=1 Tax=Chrysodeixis includens TaxID=689277 RepID=A0A9P0BWS1_CHRIL|nr:unnamed protein product [Chrysodeixis includens]